MGFSLFKHNKAKCGGDLSLEITDMFSIKTPCVSVTPDGIFVGVVELGLENHRKPAFNFCCNKCGDYIEREKFDIEIVATCMVCRKNKSLGELSTCYQISSICEECIKFLSVDNTDTIPDHIKPIASWMRLTPDIKLKNFLDIFKAPIQL